MLIPNILSDEAKMNHINLIGQVACSDLFKNRHRQLRATSTFSYNIPASKKTRNLPH